FAAFDTKVAKAVLAGSPAKAADKQLRQKGARSVADPRSFLVYGKSEGLLPGELEQARAFGASLAGMLVRR
ncbi:MAG TPA: flavodoxin, partial [Actinomycetospora sp.]|nr:flavodoxin [Actinomycetospora sp.]